MASLADYRIFEKLDETAAWAVYRTQCRIDERAYILKICIDPL